MDEHTLSLSLYSVSTPSRLDVSKYTCSGGLRAQCRSVCEIWEWPHKIRANINHFQKTSGQSIETWKHMKTWQYQVLWFQWIFEHHDFGLLCCMIRKAESRMNLTRKSHGMKQNNNNNMSNALRAMRAEMALEALKLRAKKQHRFGPLFARELNSWSLPHPTPHHPNFWRSINNVIKSKGTSSLPHPTPWCREPLRTLTNMT